MVGKVRSANALSVGDSLRYSRKVLYKGRVMPEALIFFVTSKCNAKCMHCFFWKSINQVKNELTLDEIKKFSKNLPKFSHLFIGGGEPFLRRDLPEIIETFYRNNQLKSISIPTNGILTKKIVRDIDRICSRNPGLRLIVDFSVDDLGAKHDGIRGVKGIFEKVLKSAGEIKKLKRFHRNLSLGIICVFNAKNQDSIYEIYDFIKRDIKPDSVSFALIRGNPRESACKLVDLNKYAKFCSFLKEEYKNCVFGGYNNQFISGFSNTLTEGVRRKVYETARKNKCLHPCYAAQLIGTVYSNGDVHCCEVLPNKIGNLRDVDFKFEKVWFSKEADKMREFIGKSKCFCTHECFMQINLLFNPKNLAELGYRHFRSMLK
ncbi:MAG: radical SAM protein [archaeon]